jgi:hypothetical protein
VKEKIEIDEISDKIRDFSAKIHWRDGVGLKRGWSLEKEKRHLQNVVSA